MPLGGTDMLRLWHKWCLCLIGQSTQHRIYASCWKTKGNFMAVHFIPGQVTCHNCFLKHLVRVREFLWTGTQHHPAAAWLNPPGKLWNRLSVNCVSELWFQGDGNLLKVREQARNGIQILLLFVCLGERKLKNKHTQPANKTKEAFAFPNVLLLRASAMRYSWTGISSPTLGGKNSPFCSLVVSGLWIFCFYTHFQVDWTDCSVFRKIPLSSQSIH